MIKEKKETVKRTKITKEDAALAATNTLSIASFELGGKEYKVVNLRYDDYLKFITYLTPLLETFFGSLASVGGIKVVSPSSPINAMSIVKYAGESLPELACIVCNQTDPTVTTENVKIWCENSEPRGPFKLAELVIKQIEQNKIVNDFASFFVQMLPMIKAALNQNQ